MTPHQPLPGRVVPFHNETVDSFLARLASANHMPCDTLVDHLGGERGKDGRLKTPLLDLLPVLSAVSGVARETLRRAMPEFFVEECEGRGGGGSHAFTDTAGLIERPIPRGGTSARHVCRLCAAAAEIYGPVVRWVTHDQNVCLKHLLWIGDGCGLPEDQFSMVRLPSSVHGQRMHRNIIARHGRRWVHHAFRSARKIYLAWQAEIEFGPSFELTRRWLALGRAAPVGIVDDTAKMIVFHAEIVILTGLLASYYWEREVFGSRHGLGRFLDEIVRRGLLTDWQLLTTKDELVKYIDERALIYRFSEVHRHAYPSFTSN